MKTYVALSILAVIILFAGIGMFHHKNVSTQSLMTGHEHHAIVTSEEQFIIDMIPHHQEAVESSEEIVKKSQNTKILSIAQDIIIAQSQEIDMMNQWKAEWYPDTDYVSNYRSMMSSLEALSISEAEETYLRDMIEHHKMAVAMAQQVLMLNPRSEVAAFARAVITLQSQEIAKMQTILDN